MNYTNVRIAEETGREIYGNSVLAAQFFYINIKLLKKSLNVKNG